MAPHRNRRLVAAFLAALLSLTLIQDSVAQEPASSEQDSLQQVTSDQEKLAAQYRLLEEKLYSLYEFEKQRNPGRAQVLQRAFVDSQTKMTVRQLQQVVESMRNVNLKQAESEQQRIVEQLGELLEILQSDDQTKLLRDRLKRFQDYAREVDRILRIQQGIRGQAEGGADAQRLANSEAKAAQRTGKLSDEFRSNEDFGDQPSPTEETAPSSDGNAGSDQPSSGSESEAEGNSSNSSGNSESIQQRMDRAKDRMEQARKSLEQAKRDQAVDSMREAERELEKAKRELEEILQQLREEEIEQTLAALEERFRRMLDQQLRVNASTKKLDQSPLVSRGTEFEIASNRLGKQQRDIANQAGRALILLREDGSSVAFPTTVEDLQQDMTQVASRLQAAQVNTMTMGIQEDIVESLNDLIQALVKSQEDLENQKQSGAQGQAGQPGDQPLVEQLAELKMLRSLQLRINRRHQRYAAFLSNKDDPIGQTKDPELKAALQRLADRQSQIVEITEDLVLEINK